MRDTDPATILVLDDRPVTAITIANVLEECGHIPVVALDAGAATQMLDEIQVDAMVIDVRLGDRSGIEWLEEISRTARRRGARVVVISGGRPSATELARVFRLDGTFLQKPFGGRDLLDVLRLTGNEPLAN